MSQSLSLSLLSSLQNKWKKRKYFKISLPHAPKQERDISWAWNRSILKAGGVMGVQFSKARGRCCPHLSNSFSRSNLGIMLSMCYLSSLGELIPTGQIEVPVPYMLLKPTSKSSRPTFWAYLYYRPWFFWELPWLLGTKVLFERSAIRGWMYPKAESLLCSQNAPWLRPLAISVPSERQTQHICLPAVQLHPG